MKHYKPNPDNVVSRSPHHEYWHRRVEGALRAAIGAHPAWFNLETERIKNGCVRSIAKRIVGEIVAGCANVAARDDAASCYCPRCGLAGVVITATTRPSVGAVLRSAPTEAGRTLRAGPADRRKRAERRHRPDRRKSA